MATEKLELEILANGKPAEKAIKGVENKTEQLGKTSKKTGEETDGMLTRMKAGWIAVGASMAIAVNKAATFERASIGLTQAQKEWAKETALATDISAEQVAGFLKSAETAGLAEDQMKKLAEQAIALGYAFPHEDAETLHDNLVMLNTTGEAQGFIVDILEQKLAKAGVAFENMDLKALSAAEKLQLVNEVVAESQSQMDASNFQEYNEVLGRIDNSMTTLGQTIVSIATESGALGLFNKMLGGAELLLNRVHLGVLSLTGIFSETNEERARWLELAIQVLEKDEKLYGSDNQAKLSEYKKELSEINGELEKQKGLVVQVTASSKELEESMTWTDKARQYLQDMGADLDSFGAGWSEATGNVKTATEQWKAAGKASANAIGSYLTNMVMGVKTSFSDLTRFIIAQLVQMAIMQKIVQPLGVMMGFHTGTTTVKHTGGAIGTAAIPSYHTGFRSDERLAKLQVGEAVINRHGTARNKDAIDAMNKGMAVGGGGGNVTTAEIVFNVQAIDAASFNNYLVGNKHTIENIVVNSLNTNGTVRQTIKQVV